MGLEIKVFTHIKEIEARNEEIECFCADVIIPDWDERIKNLKKGSWYTGTASDWLVSYPHSFHNDFRRWLSRLIGKENNAWIQESKDADPTGPFFEFFDFADNEGCMDWETAHELLKDFVQWELDVRSLEDSYWKDRYYEWMEVFKQASVNGVVVYS